MILLNYKCISKKKPTKNNFLAGFCYGFYVYLNSYKVTWSNLQ